MKNQNQLQVGNTAPIFTFNTPWEEGIVFDTTKSGAAILFFLRYIGCPVCQFEMAKIKRDIELAGHYKVFVVLQSDPKKVSSKSEKGDWPLTIICDPKSEIFKLFRVEPGSILEFMNPRGLLAAIKATLKGHIHGKFEGSETQLPATFVIEADKKIQYVYYGKRINDVPSLIFLSRH
jgi:peroxiredoxin Q/BCP